MGVSSVVAIDLGGTLTKVGAACSDGTVTDVIRLPTERGADGSVPTGWLAELIRARAADRGTDCVGFAVVVPGVIDSVRQTVRAAPNVGWTDLPLGAELGAELDLPGTIGHDVRAGGLAEWRLGAGVGARNLLVLPLGTGIAGAVVVDGQLLEADGFAGEIGHLRVSPAAEHRCACGLFGCLETVASAAGVSRGYARLSGDVVDAETVADRARLGDQAAQQTFAVARAALVEALADYVSLLGPELVVVGGGLAGAADLLLDEVGCMLADRLSFHRVPRIVTARLGADAGLIGAGLLGWEHVGAVRGSA